jgi:hypothetical protein
MTRSLTTQDRVVVNPNCLLTELGDGTGVLLDLDTKFYFTLNETGVFAWKAISKHPATAEELAAMVAGVFEVSVGRALADISALLDQLVVDALIRRA